MTAGSHPREALHELLDGRLSEAARTEVEQHVASCAACQRELDLLRFATETAAEALKSGAPPADLEARVLAALDREDAAAGSGAAPRSRRGLMLAAAAAVVLAVALGLLWPRLVPDLPGSAARGFDQHVAGRLPLELESDEIVATEQFFRDRGLEFPTRVLDLGMMQYRVAGGRIHELGGSPSAFFVYHGPDGQVLVCQMYEGRMEDLPAGFERREHGGIEFRIYERNGRTVVFWPEGGVVCVLVSGIDREEVVGLAFAKAMKV